MTENVTNLHPEADRDVPMTQASGIAVLGDLAVRGYAAKLCCAPGDTDTVNWWIEVDAGFAGLNSERIQGLIDVATAHHRELLTKTLGGIEIR